MFLIPVHCQIFSTGNFFFNIVCGGFLMQFWRFSRGNAHAPVAQMGKHSYCLWDTSHVL